MRSRDSKSKIKEKLQILDYLNGEGQYSFQRLRKKFDRQALEEVLLFFDERDMLGGVTKDLIKVKDENIEFYKKALLERLE